MNYIKILFRTSFLIALSLPNPALFAESSVGVASVTIIQPISATSSPVYLGNVSVSSGFGGDVTLSDLTCTTSVNGSIEYTGNASCGTINVVAADNQAISLSLASAGAFTLSDANGHTLSGTLSISSSSCYASGAAPLCSSIKIGGTVTIAGTNINPVGSYSSSNPGGANATLLLQYS